MAAAKPKSTAVAKNTKKTGAVADVTHSLEDMFAADSGAGNENMGADDLAIPFLKIVSKNDDDLLARRRDIMPGDLINTVTENAYYLVEGREDTELSNVTVVPCAYKRVHIKWAPRGSGNGAPLAIYESGDQLPETERDPATNNDMVVGENGTYLQETHQQYVMIINEDGTFTNALIALKSTQLKHSRKWNSMISERKIRTSSGAIITPPRYSTLFRLGTKADSNDKGNWHSWTMEVVGFLDDPEIYGAAKTFSEAISAGDVIVKHENEDEDSGGGQNPDARGGNEKEPF